MRQLLYVSLSTTPAEATPLGEILHQSLHNNALDGITGLLWSDGKRFAQVIEGDDRAIEDAMERIRADPRHCEIVVVRDRTIEEREFGDWTMEVRMPGRSEDIHDERMRRALLGSSDAIRQIFMSLLAPIDA